MQQLTGLLVEYLATGSASLLWVLLLILLYARVPSNIDHPAVIALLLPLTYLLGMISDFLGERVLHSKKEAIKDDARKGTAVEKLQTRQIHAKIVTYSPDLAKELNIRSSRDRIARGVLVNIPFIGIATVLCFVKNLARAFQVYLAAGLTIPLTVLLTSVVYSMWRRFQEGSYKFEVFAYQAVEEKLNVIGPSSSAH